MTTTTSPWGRRRLPPPPPTSPWGHRRLAPPPPTSPRPPPTSVGQACTLDIFAHLALLCRDIPSHLLRRSRSLPFAPPATTCRDDQRGSTEKAWEDRAPRALKTPRSKIPPSPPKDNLVNHAYVDLSSLPGSASVTFDRPKGRGYVPHPFPDKLHDMLEDVALSRDLADVISWRPHGRAFVVHQPHRFVRDVLPRYFRQSKLTSFQRQLCIYGFRRITRGEDAGAYYHECFLRGRRALCVRMERVKVKGTGRKPYRNPEEEPDFYTMPSLFAHTRPGLEDRGAVHKP
uniref:HSF-type DNA-binding domain-containing protein n=1 Tax=Corethron hystrix TaxID=216773 RepID=A0A7S1BSD1_9STRA|mmetsp:Transcript_39382/g.91948  ORF Transcript_39382/g.91948 Transcript_39382/m.91948 type:complete len:287 (+) Transcript_39382:327-1187(+)